MMTGQHKSQPFCLFGPCGQSLPLPDTPFNPVLSPKRQKVSLKRPPCRHNYLAQSASQPQSPMAARTVVEVSPGPPAPPVILLASHYVQSRPSVTPRPTVRFSWNAELEQTRKKETPPAVQAVQAEEPAEEELKKTRQIKNILGNLSDQLGLHKASVISIQDLSPKLPPKVEESMVMVDYFNPSDQQLSRLEKYLQNKSTSSMVR